MTESASRPRASRLHNVAFAVLVAWLVFYYATSASLWDASDRWDVAFIGFVLMPSTLGLVYFALPYRRSPGLWLIGVSSLALAFALHAIGLNTLADFAKLGAMTAIGFWFLTYFEQLAWVVLVSLIVPWVDAYSVWRGPTSHILEHHGSTFSLLSFSFPFPGEHNAANLGLPDLLFFSLFLAAADRWGLRVRLTWLLMAGFLGLTLTLAYWRDLAGLPALPFLSAGFLLANCDLLWKQWRQSRKAKPAGSEA